MEDVATRHPERVLEVGGRAHLDAGGSVGGFVEAVRDRLGEATCMKITNVVLVLSVLGALIGITR